MPGWHSPAPDDPEEEWVQDAVGNWVRRPVRHPTPPKPRDWEAHRRIRHFHPGSGRLLREDHEAVRVRFRASGGAALPRGRVREPGVVSALLLATCTHGALWFGTMSVLAFGPSPWWAVVPALAIPFVLGWRGTLVHAGVVWLLGSLFIAFDGYFAFVMLLPVAALFAPGRWVDDAW